MTTTMATNTTRKRAPKMGGPRPTDGADKPHDVRTQISPEAGRAVMQRQLDLGLTYPGHKPGGRKWPLAAIYTEILEAALLGTKTGA